MKLNNPIRLLEATRFDNSTEFSCQLTKKLAKAKNYSPNRIQFCKQVIPITVAVLGLWLTIFNFYTL
jgi:hypothetical protein